jgi:hypothetical protein
MRFAACALRLFIRYRRKMRRAESAMGVTVTRLCWTADAGAMLVHLNAPDFVYEGTLHSETGDGHLLLPVSPPAVAWMHAAHTKALREPGIVPVEVLRKYDGLRFSDVDDYQGAQILVSDLQLAFLMRNFYVMNPGYAEDSEQERESIPRRTG